jgi:hypothetical protein
LRHLLSILDELEVPYNKLKLPREFWHSRGELLVQSVEELKELIFKIRVQKEEKVDTLSSMLLYPLPIWLREEFTVAEILLYQHQFQRIDKDGGGSIDVEELQSLFLSLGTTISFEQVRD